jgi:hypothetical protein
MRTNDRIRPPNASFSRELPRTPSVSDTLQQLSFRTGFSR